MPGLRAGNKNWGAHDGRTLSAVRWRTLKLLLLQPDELTAEYLRCQRKRYVMPLHLVLSMAVVMLLTLRLLGSIDTA